MCKSVESNRAKINRSVLSKQIRILFLPNPTRLSPLILGKKFLPEIIRYTEEKDFNALGWIKGAGDQGNTYSIRAEKGRRNLSEYNRKNNCHIKVVRDHTVHLSDIENIR
ncbi:hypothetical protein COOONC_08840 [Cooperia oncophora]